MGRGRTPVEMKEVTAGGQWASRSVETGASSCCDVAEMQKTEEEEGKGDARLETGAQLQKGHSSQWSHLLPASSLG